MNRFKSGLVLLFAMCLAFLSSCSAPRTVECYLVEYSNAEEIDISTFPKSELQRWNGQSFKAEDAEKTVKVNFDGKEYEGEYLESTYYSYNSYRTDDFMNKDGTWISINADTGELAGINIMSVERYKEEKQAEDVKDAESVCEAIAREYASRYADLSEYSLLKSNQLRYSDSYSTYTFLFAKEIDGIRTADWISCSVTSKGTIFQINFGDLGVMDRVDKSEIDRFRNIDAEELLAERVKEQIPELRSFAVDSLCYAVTPEGELVLMARCSGSMEDYDVGFEFMIK